MFRGSLFVLIVLCFENTNCLTSVPNETESETVSAKRKIVVTGSHNEIRIINGQGTLNRLESRLDDLEKSKGKLHSLATKLHALKTMAARLRSFEQLLNHSQIAQTSQGKKIKRLMTSVQARLESYRRLLILSQNAQTRLSARMKDLQLRFNGRLNRNEQQLNATKQDIATIGSNVNILQRLDGRVASNGKSIKALENQNTNFSSYERRIETLEQQVNRLMTLHNTFGVLFPRSSTSDYITLRNVIPRPLVAVTVCFWMNSADTKNKGTPFSYSTAKHDNALLIYNYKQFQLWIKNAYRQTTVSANDGKWHQICFTWKSSAGSWALYKDGLIKASGKGFKSGEKIQGGGILVIGQEQDAYGGTFDVNQSFVGKMATVNIWSKAMSPREISLMTRSCALGKGDIMQWSDVRGHYNGNATEVSSSSCA